MRATNLTAVNRATDYSPVAEHATGNTTGGDLVGQDRTARKMC